MEKTPPAMPPGTLSLAVLQEQGGAVADCAADPLDLRPARDSIIDRVERARASLCAAGKSGPVVVLMGERHMRPVTKVLQMMLLDHFAADGGTKTACGLEYPHDGLGVLMEQCGFPVSAESYARLRANDPDGRRGLTVSLAALTMSDAPVTHDTLLNYCRNNNVSLRFTDAAKTADGGMLDRRDPLTGAVMAQCVPPAFAGQDIPAASNVGVAIRNVVMVQNVMTHIRDSGASLYLQHCGADHVFGHRSDQCAYEHSLTALFQQVGIATVPVFDCVDDSDIAALPVSALRTAFANSVTITHASDAAFRHGAAGEADFLRRLGSRSGIALPVFEKETPDHNGVVDGLRRDGPVWLSQLSA